MYKQKLSKRNDPILNSKVSKLFKDADVENLVLELDNGTLHVSGGSIYGGSINFEESEFDFDNVSIYESVFDPKEAFKISNCEIYVSQMVNLNYGFLDNCRFSVDGASPTVFKGKMTDCVLDDSASNMFKFEGSVLKGTFKNNTSSGIIFEDCGVVRFTFKGGKSKSGGKNSLFSKCDITDSKLESVALDDCLSDTTYLKNCEIRQPVDKLKSIHNQSKFHKCEIIEGQEFQHFHNCEFKQCIANGTHHFFKHCSWEGGICNGTVVLHQDLKFEGDSGTIYLGFPLVTGQETSIDIVKRILVGPLTNDNPMIVRAKEWNEILVKTEPLMVLFGIKKDKRPQYFKSIIDSVLTGV